MASMQAVIILATPHGIVLAVLGDSENVLGWPLYDIIAASLVDTIIPERFRAAHAAGLDRYLSTGEAPIIGARLELFALGADGVERPVHLTVFGKDDYTGCFFALVQKR